MFCDGFEQFVDSHASGQGLEIEVREDLHDQLIGEVVDVRHIRLALWRSGGEQDRGDSEIRGASSVDGELL